MGKGIHHSKDVHVTIGFELDRIHLTLIHFTALVLPTIMACCHGFVLLTSATLINLKYLYPCTGQVQAVVWKSINIRPNIDSRLIQCGYFYYCTAVAGCHCPCNSIPMFFVFKVYKLEIVRVNGC